MCLFLEMLWVKKCRNLSGGKYFPITVNIFAMPKIWNYFFWDHLFICGGNITYDLFYQLVINMAKYLPQKGNVLQKGKVSQNNSCLMTLIISLFWQIFPHINDKLIKLYILQRLVSVSMHFLNVFYKYIAQYSAQASDCFLTKK